MSGARADAYLQRIGAARGAAPDLDTLRRLQRAHLGAVPFENLSIHLGEPIVLEVPALLEKIVGRRRGGFCYELNGAFGALLTELGYRVTLMSARVYGGGRLGPPLDHLALRVDLDEPWLADVGFGAFSHHPLRLADRHEQPDPGGRFVISEAPDGQLDVSMDGAPQYRVDPRPYALTDFEPTCWWQQTSPRSHFRKGPVCSRLTDAGRITLSGRTLVRTVDGRREEQEIEAADLLGAYRQHFGIALERSPAIPSG